MTTNDHRPTRSSGPYRPARQVWQITYHHLARPEDVRPYASDIEVGDTWTTDEYLYGDPIVTPCESSLEAVPSRVRAHADMIRRSSNIVRIEYACADLLDLTSSGRQMAHRYLIHDTDAPEYHRAVDA